MAFSSRTTRPSTGEGAIVGAAGTPPPPGAPMTPATGSDTPTNVAYAPPPPETVAALSAEHVRADGQPSTPIDPANLGLTAAELARKYEAELQPLQPPAGPPLTTSQAIAAGIIPAGSPQGYGGTIPDGNVGVVHAPIVPVLIAPVSGPPLPPPPPGYSYAAVPGSHTGAIMLVPNAAAETVPAPPVVVQGPAVPAASTEPVVLAAGVPRPPATSHQPAASNSDSPSRGIPRPSDDPNKQITGGFGLGGGLYYPLDGTEVAAVVGRLVDQLKFRMSDDLRFTLSQTYPRVGIVVEVRVEGYPDDQGFTVRETQVLAVAARREVESDGAGGEIRRAPDEFRAEAGLAIPHKQVVGSGTGRTLVDVVPAAPAPAPPGAGVSALTR